MNYFYAPLAKLSGRQAMSQVASGFGAVALRALLVQEAAAGGSEREDQRLPHHPARARRVIFLFMNGGPSQVDLFDPKPRLTRDHGKPLHFEKPKLARTTTENLMACPFKFKKYGQAGIEATELL